MVIAVLIYVTLAVLFALAVGRMARLGDAAITYPPGRSLRAVADEVERAEATS